jgi:nucleoside phosphorylase
MKILVVDDEYNKVREITDVLSKIEIVGLEVEQETTAQAARRLLRAADYDMLIIDLHLPASMGATPNKNGGVDLFDMICLDEEVKLPTDILFITGREELLEEANSEVIQRGGVLCQYRSDSDEWKKILTGRVRYLYRRIANRNPIDIAIVTALRNPELDAVLKLPYGFKAKRFENNPVTYHFGSVPRLDGNISVVCATPNRKGMPSSAVLAAKLTHMFRPKYLVMLGICAGIPDKCNPGDVIVADPSWDWGCGKQGIDAKGSSVFQVAPYQMQLNNGIRQLASDIANNQEILESIRGKWLESTPQGKLNVHVGPMASGASVVADNVTAKLIDAQHRELLAIDMEAYAVMAAAEYADDPKPIAVIIKSVCDFGDVKKNDDWQEYASYTSSAFADQLFRNHNLSFAR